MLHSIQEQAKQATYAHPQVIAKLKQHWKKTGFYEYQNQEGHPIFWKIRLDPPEGSQEKKWIRPLHFDGNNWILKEPHFNGKKLLYRLPNLIAHPHGIKWIVEGERCVNRLTKLGVIATTSGAADSALVADWIPLANQQIIIWPDHDEAGLRYAQEVTQQLQSLQCNVKWIDVKKLNLSDKEDVVDWLKTNPHATKIDIENLPLIEPQLNAQKTYVWVESPKPLQRELPPPSPFPVDALGDLLAPAAYKIAEATQAPMAICAQSLLAAATLAVQAHADIEIQGRISPLSEFFLTVANSGERKSAVDRVALYPHRLHQENLREIYTAKFNESQHEQAAFEASKKEALSSKKNKNFEDKKRALENLGKLPAPPIEPLFIFEEPTYEGLVKLFVTGQPSVGLFNDEGGRFIGGHGMNHENLLKTATGLSALWDGRSITRLRAGDGAALLLGRRLSLHLMAQPSIAQLLLSNNTLMEQGFLSRCLVTWPASTVGTRFYRDIDLSESQELKRYTAKMLDLLETPQPLREGKQNELNPRKLSLSEKAKALWKYFYDVIEGRLADGKELPSIRGIGNKAAEHAARLAGVLALVDDVHCTEISVIHMRNGIHLIEHYLNEALRLFEAGNSDPDLSLAEKLLQWLKHRNQPTITLVEIYQTGPNAIRNTQTARTLMNILTEHGWVLPLNEGEVYKDIHRQEAWQVRL